MLQHYPHICKDADTCLDRIRNLELDPDDFFVRIDVEEIFMSGSHRTLAETAVAMVRERSQRRDLANAVDDAVSFLLFKQYVSSDLMPNRICREKRPRRQNFE